jgi:hypothetical protein
MFLEEAGVEKTGWEQMFCLNTERTQAQRE